MVDAVPRPSPVPRVKPWAAAAAARAEAAAARAAAPSARAPQAAPKYGPGEWLETKSLRGGGEDLVRVAGVRVDPRQNGSYIYIVQGIPSYEMREPRRFPLHGSTYELCEAKLRPLPHDAWIDQRARWGDAMTEEYEAALASAAFAPPPPPGRRELWGARRRSEPEPQHIHASAEAFRAAPRTTPSAADVAASHERAVFAALRRRAESITPAEREAMESRAELSERAALVPNEGLPARPACVVLALGSGATEADAARAFRCLAKQYHPDKWQAAGAEEAARS